MEIGDVPGWIAIFLSLGSLGRQWYVERKNSKINAKEVSLARLTAMESTTAEVRALGMSYWLRPRSESEPEALMLIHHLKILSRDVDRYSSLLWSNAVNDVRALKMSLTGSRFQELGRPCYSPNDAFVKVFMEKASTITAKIKDAADALDNH